MPQFQSSADLSKESPFVRDYCVTMLWANTQEYSANGELAPAEPDRTQDAQVTRKALREARSDAYGFLHALEGKGRGEDPALLAEWERYKEARSVEDAGGDFALSRNGHGAGFFSRDDGYPLLQAHAKTFGSADWILNRRGNATPL